MFDMTAPGFTGIIVVGDSILAATVDESCKAGTALARSLRWTEREMIRDSS
jgi:hypothetical protein